MPILSSPGVAVVEKDFSQIVTFEQTSAALIAGDFVRGPINEPRLITDVKALARVFGRPRYRRFASTTQEDKRNAAISNWYVAANYLNYGTKLWVVRSKPTGLTVAAAGSTASTLAADGSAARDLILNRKDYENKVASLTTDIDKGLDGTTTHPQFGEWLAKHPGSAMNDVAVCMVDAGNWTQFVTWIEGFEDTIDNFKPWTEMLKNKGAPDTSDFVYRKAEGLHADKIAINDELHIFIFDITGTISGRPMGLLEMYEGLSKCRTARDPNGEKIYYADVINAKSKYVWWSAHPVNSDLNNTTDTAWGADPEEFVVEVVADVRTTQPFRLLDSTTFAATSNSVYVGTGVKQFQHGDDADKFSTDANIIAAYEEAKNIEEYSYSFILSGTHSDTVIASLVEIAEDRKDCLVFISPKESGAIPIIADQSSIAAELISYHTTLANTVNPSSYAVMDSGYKYQWDSYNGKYIWVPLNGDVAGLCARTDAEAEPWFSPAGFNRGQIKGATKLSSVLTQDDRDLIYQYGINPVVQFRGEGTILFGDKTMQRKASAFDHINVRRLFIILEKSIARAAKYQLFQLNDAFTRSKFVGMIEPFLRTVKGRRGLADFRVICDESNNTEDVVSRNEFIADIYIKPLYSINYIVLNFVAVKSTVQFQQIDYNQSDI